MLVSRRKIISFLLTIAILSLLSSFSLIYSQRIVIEPLYWQSKSSSFFIALLFITMITILHLFIKDSLII